MTALLDTDTVIYLLRGLRIAETRSARHKQWRETGERIFRRARAWSARRRVVALSAITVAELEFGARHCVDYEAERDVLHRVLAPFELLDFDAGACAGHYGEIRHTLESVGKPIGSLDTLIAAHARAIGAMLVTNNTAEFSRVPGLELANWAEA